MEDNAAILLKINGREHYFHSNHIENVSHNNNLKKEGKKP
jgi:hypothetical protein